MATTGDKLMTDTSTLKTYEEADEVTANTDAVSFRAAATSFSPFTSPRSMANETSTMAEITHRGNTPLQGRPAPSGTHILLSKISSVPALQDINQSKDASAAPSRSHTPTGSIGHSPRIGPMPANTLSIPGLTKSKLSPDGRISDADVGAKLVIIMVGLPARGKSYITKKLARYLNWLQYRTRIFNVGNRRRLAASVAAVMGEGHNANFFDPLNADGRRSREEVAMSTLDELIHWILYESGSVGILDATNSTLDRRRRILERIRREEGLNVLFLESICTDKKLLEANMHLKLSGPDYKDKDAVQAYQDFQQRVRNYEKAYETISDYEESIKNFQYVKVINVGKKLVAYNIQGFLASQAISFLMNMNLADRQIWITRHGEVDNPMGKLGGNAPLTEEGVEYSRALVEFIDLQRIAFRERELQAWADHTLPPTGKGDYEEENGEGDNAVDMPRISSELREPPQEKSFSVWTSMLNRTAASATFFDDKIYAVKALRLLDEVHAGDFEGLTPADILRDYPDEFEHRRLDKLHYRYPGAGGESYLDVIHRLQPVIMEIERMSHHVLLICHRVVARILLGFFLEFNQDQIAHLDVPFGALYALEPHPYRTQVRKFIYDKSQRTFHETPVESNGT